MDIASTNMIIIIRYHEIKSIDKALPFHQVNCSRTNMFQSTMPEPHRPFIDRECSMISIFGTSDEI